VEPSIVQELAGLEVADELGGQEVQRAGLARQDVTVAFPPQHERPEPPGIPGGVQRFAHRDQERIRALHPGERVRDLLFDRVPPRAGDEVNDHLGVDRRLEERTLRNHLRPERARVRQITIVDQRQVALVIPHHDRLGVRQAGPAGRRITNVTERDPTRQPPQRLVVERLGHQPGRLVDPRHAILDGADPGGFLTPVLQRIKAEEHQLGRVIDSRNAYDSAHWAQ